ncbi:MAG: hypothetical protein ACFCVK_12715 [Acidimicrobiales bacterium]
MRRSVTLFAALLVLGACSSGDDSATDAEGVETAADQTTEGSLSRQISGGNLWEVTATPPVDITDAVLGASEYAEPPPDGVVYAGTELTMTLVSLGEDASTTPGIDWTIDMESPDATYGFSTMGLPGCGAPPDEIDLVSELAVGATVSGTYCIPVPADQVDQVRVVIESVSGERLTASP